MDLPRVGQRPAEPHKLRIAGCDSRTRHLTNDQGPNPNDQSNARIWSLVLGHWCLVMGHFDTRVCSWESRQPPKLHYGVRLLALVPGLWTDTLDAGARRYGGCLQSSSRVGSTPTGVSSKARLRYRRTSGGPAQHHSPSCLSVRRVPNMACNAAISARLARVGRSPQGRPRREGSCRPRDQPAVNHPRPWPEQSRQGPFVLTRTFLPGGAATGSQDGKLVA